MADPGNAPTHGSVPDLSKLPALNPATLLNLATSEHNIAQRKRKHGDDFTDALNNVTDKIMDTLKTFKADFESQLAQVNDNIGNVQKDIAKFSETTQEIRTELKLVRKEYSDIKTLVQELKTQNSEVRKEFNALEESVKFTSDKFDEMKEKTDAITVEIGRIKLIETQLQDLKVENKRLTSEINEQNQRERNLNIEIVGIPEFPNEDLSKIIKDYAQHVGVAIESSDILHVHRVTPRIKVEGRPRVIVAKIKSRELKDNIISGTRKTLPTTKDINLQGDPKPIFVNEHLTYYNKQLFKKCKDAAKLKQYEYVWTKNGRIYARKDESTHLISIKDEEDIKKLI